MREASFFRAKHSPRRNITFSLQVIDDILESSVDVSFDIFKEAVVWPDDADAFDDPRPQMARVFLSIPMSSFAEWLTGVTSRKNVHAPTKLLPREGFKICPDRSWIQDSLLNFCEKVCDRKSFPLTVSDCAAM
jgi:hypothetical protein